MQINVHLVISWRGGKRKDLHVCAPTSSRQRSRLGNNPFGSLMMPRLRLREKNNSGLIIEDQLDGTVPHSGGSSCVAPSISCRGIAEKMNRRSVRRERVKSRHGVLRTGVGSSLPVQTRCHGRAFGGGGAKATVATLFSVNFIWLLLFFISSK